MLCDGEKSEVHHFDIAVIKGGVNGVFIGIDEGNSNLNGDYIEATTHHYGLKDIV